MNKKIEKRNNTIKIFLLWGACGLLTWWLALYLFSFVLYKFVPNLQYIKNNISSPIVLSVSSILAFHAGEYILSVIISAIVCSFTGFRPVWFTGFLIGVAIIPFYGLISGLFAYLDLYTSLPNWVSSWIFQEFISILFILPFSIWAGCLIGKQIRRKRQIC